MDNKQFGIKLAYMRTQKNMTQAELSKNIGVAESTVANYENGSRKPSLDTLIRISELFNESVDWFLLNKLSKESHSLKLLDMKIDSFSDKSKRINERIIDSTKKLQLINVPLIENIHNLKTVKDITKNESTYTIAGEFSELENLFAVKIKNFNKDIYPEIKINDILVLKQALSRDLNDKIVIVNVDGETKIRRLYTELKGYALIPLSRGSSPEFYTNAEFKELNIAIIGELVKLIRTDF